MLWGALELTRASICLDVGQGKMLFVSEVSDRRTAALQWTRVYREQRIATRCRVEFERLGKQVTAASEDLSASGVFVRSEALLPVNAVVKLRLELPGKDAVWVSSRVAHVLSATAARALGRQVGMGMQFLEFEGPGRDTLDDYLDGLVDEITPPPSQLARGSTVVLADPSMPRLGRITSALTAAGFEVRAVADGSDAYSAIQLNPPQIIVVSDDVPHMDGWTLLRRLARKGELGRIPVVLMSDDGGDVTRLQAYRLGVRDFIPRPFLDEELILRLRRIALEQHHVRADVLRGNLREISIATLLSLLDFERKSGVLRVARGELEAHVHVTGGRVIRVDSEIAADGSPRDRLYAILDWPGGSFRVSHLRRGR